MTTDIDIMSRFVAMYEAQEGARQMAMAMSVAQDPKLAAALRERAQKRLAEVSHQAAKIRGLLAAPQEEKTPDAE